MRSKDRVVKVLLSALGVFGLCASVWWICGCLYSHPAKTFPLGRCIAYAWIDDHSLLLVRHEHSWGLYRLDITTRRETPLRDLTERVRAYPTTENFQVSPDGRWLLWENARHHIDKTGRRSETFTVQAATLDGKQFVSHPLGGYRSIDGNIPNPYCWMGDSRHWIELSRPGRSADTCFVTLHALDKPQTITTPVRNPNDVFPLDGTFFHRGSRLFFADDFHYYEYSVGEIAKSEIIVELSEPPHFTTIRRYASPVPKTVDTDTMNVSPDGRFLGRIEPVAMAESWTTRLMRYLHRTPMQQMHRLIVCDLNGQHSHTIGAPIASLLNSHDPIRDLQWSPDGRLLSYMSDGMLTVVANK